MSESVKVDQGRTLVNVSRVDFTNEVTGEKFTIEDTAKEIDVEPILSKGKRDILRVKNRILGINELEDIVIGYKLKMKDNTFNMKVMELIDGGTIESGKYLSTPAGEEVKKYLFTIDVYTEEKNYNRTQGYIKFTWKHCKGKAPKWKMTDGKFIVPEFEAESFPFRREVPVEIDFTDSIGITKPDKEKETEMKIKGGKVTDSNKDVKVEITSNIKWIFTKPINQDDVTLQNFIVKKKSDDSVVDGNVTIDESKKIVTFIPMSIEKDSTYVAEAKSVNLLDESGTTTAIDVEFTTI